MTKMPPLDRSEWLDILEGKHSFSSFAPRLLIDRVQKQVEAGELTKLEAITQIASFFGKYKNAYKKEMQAIFVDWNN